jgi:hypothetical protein
MGRHPLTPTAVPDPGSVPITRLLLVVVAATVLLSVCSLGNNRGVAALSFPIPVIAAPEPAPYDLDQEEEQLANPKEESYRLGEEEVTKLRQRILEGLGLTRTPDASKVSKAWLAAPRSCSLEFAQLRFCTCLSPHLGLTVWPLCLSDVWKTPPERGTARGLR